MDGKIGKKALAVLWWSIWAANAIFSLFDALQYSATWFDFFSPVVVGIGFLGATALAVRFPRVSLTIAAGVGLYIVAILLFGLAEHWHQWLVEDWYVTLVVVYLPLMGLVWLGYSRLRPRT